MEYSAGPTIFDRRASGESSAAAEAAYADRMRATQQEEAVLDKDTAATPPAQAAPAPMAEQPHTLLVFKDGHQVEVQNYAILGATLYDMTPGHRNRIALADLNLPATVKENDDRGIDFQLPVTPSAN